MITSGVLCRGFFGRSEETAYLVDRALGRRPPSGGGLVVRGGAGIGKSRLVDEFVGIARASGARIGVAHAREYANAPYLAVDEALLELGVAADAHSGPETEKGQRFAAIGAALRDLARAGPVVVAVEDLHWADGGSVELLRYLVKGLRASPVLVVATYRTEDVEDDSMRSALLSALERDAGDVLTLAPLPVRVIDTIVDAALVEVGRRVPPATRARITELSEGRPLFAEELLRGVLERQERDGMYEPIVPNSIRASVHERFSRLQSPDRDVLLHAAVVGRRFSATFVSTLLGREPAGVYPALRHARELQLIVEEDDPAGDLFAFRHALTREAVYAELLRAEARALHGLVARKLAGRDSADVAAVAEHAWRGGDADAAAWNERAGASALSVHAYADAATAFERAFEVSAHPADRARLSERVADALYALGATERSAAWYGTAAQAQDDAGETRRAWRLRLRHARVLVEAGRYDEGIATADRIATSGEGADAELRFEADVMVAGLVATTGRPADALTRLERAAALDAKPDDSVAARYSGALAYTFSLLGRAGEARRRFDDAVATARSIGDGDLAFRTLNNWGNLELGYGKLEAARRLYREALDAAEGTKNMRHAGMLSANAALGAIVGGELDEGRRLLERSIAIEHGVRRVRKWTFALDLRVRQLTGEIGDALERSVALLDEALRENDLSSAALLAAAGAYVYGARGQAAEAAKIAGSVVGVLDVAEPPFWVLDAASRFGEPLVRARARDLLADVAQREEAWPARGFLELADGRTASRARRRDDAVEHAERAATAFRQAGWVLDEAYALQAAGRTADAVAAFERAGAHAEVRRLTALDAPGLRRRGEATLTGREREIAALVAAGRSARGIAESLVISERTVETHVAAVYRKLGVANRRELVELLSRVTTAPP